MLLVRYQCERFTAGAQIGRKGDESIIPQAQSRKSAAFIAILFCHGEEANGIFLHRINRCAKNSGVSGVPGFTAFHGLMLLL